MATTDDPKQRNYLQPGFPILSFLYALYCDAEFSQANFDAWKAAKDAGRDYRSYLDLYRNDPTRPFPAYAIQMIAEWVPEYGTKDPKTGRSLPTADQARQAMPYVLAELTGAPAEPPPPGPPPPPPSPPQPRRFASPSADRPLLSCLSVIFLNGDPAFRSDTGTFLARFTIPAAAREVLARFAKSNQQHMPPGEAMSLAPALVEEFAKQPPVW